MTGEERHFWLRRLHSLSGIVPVGGFIAFHLYENYSATRGADAYNAMTSNRPYRDAMPSRVARLRLAQAVDSQFDTNVVATFEAILAGADEEYRLAKRGDFREFAQRTYDASDGLESVAEVA